MERREWVAVGMRDFEVLYFQSRTAPVHLFNISNFLSSRQRGVGGVAMKNYGWITR
jgi:hypothetical protein